MIHFVMGFWLGGALFYGVMELKSGTVDVHSPWMVLLWPYMLWSIATDKDPPV